MSAEKETAFNFVLFYHVIVSNLVSWQDLGKYRMPFESSSTSIPSSIQYNFRLNDFSEYVHTNQNIGIMIPNCALTFQLNKLNCTISETLKYRIIPITWLQLVSSWVWDVLSCESGSVSLYRKSTSIIAFEIYNVEAFLRFANKLNIYITCSRIANVVFCLFFWCGSFQSDASHMEPSLGFTNI